PEPIGRAAYGRGHVPAARPRWRLLVPAMARFFDGARAVAHDVTPQLTDRALLLLAADGSVLATWPFRRIVAVSEPDVGVTTLASKGGPARLVVEDAQLLQRLAEAGARVGRRQVWRARHLAALTCGALAMLVGVVMLVDRAPQLAARLVPTAWEDP